MIEGLLSRDLAELYSKCFRCGFPHQNVVYVVDVHRTVLFSVKYGNCVYHVLYVLVFHEKVTIIVLFYKVSSTFKFLIKFDIAVCRTFYSRNLYCTLDIFKRIFPFFVFVISLKIHSTTHNPTFCVPHGIRFENEES